MSRDIEILLDREYRVLDPRRQKANGNNGQSQRVVGRCGNCVRNNRSIVDATGSNVADGEFAPVERKIGSEHCKERCGDIDDGEGRIAQVDVSRPAIGKSQQYEGERDRIGADHPLAVLHDLAIPRCKEGRQGADHPGTRMNALADEEVAAGREEQSQHCGQKNRRHVDTTKHPMEAKVPSAETRGKLSGTAQESQGTEKYVWDEQIAIANEVIAVVVKEGSVAQDG